MNWPLLRNSLLVSTLATLLAVAFGLAAALWAAGLPGRWQRRLLGVAVMALALPPFLAANCWLHYLGQAGVWHRWLPLDIVSPGGTVWILGLLTWPITLLAVWGAWRRLEPAQLESDPRVRGWALFRGLLLPLGRNALAQAAVLTFVLALNNFAVPTILQVRVFPAEVWVRFSANLDALGALSLSWPLVLGPLLLLLWFIGQEIPWPRVEGPVPPKLFRRHLGGPWFWSCGALTLSVCVLAVGLPLFQLAAARRTWTELPGALAAGQGALFNSAWFAAVSATLVVGLGLAASRSHFHGQEVLGWLLSRFTFHVSRFTFHFRGQEILGWVLWLPLLVPGVLLGIGLIAVFNRDWSLLFYRSAGIVVLAFVVRYLALGWNTMSHAARGVDPDLTDAARLEGATSWQLLRHVIWPQVAPQAAAAWYVVFLLCLWDVESIILVVPPGGETLSLRVFNLLHYGHNAQVNALCLILLGLAVAPLALWMGGRAVSGCLTGRTCRTGRTLALPALLLGLLAGCSPPPSSNEAPLQSRLFSRAQIIGSRGVGLGQFNKPRSVAVDLEDNLYVVDMTGRVQKFSSNGLFLLSWQMPQTDLGKPKGMCRDGQGNIVVVEPHYQRVNHFTPAGQLAAQWGRRGTNAGQFMLPRAVAVNSQDQILVSEYGPAERVQRFSLTMAGLGRPLTPTLSPSDGERGQQATALASSSASGFLDQPSTVHPLPVGRGEGRGEGKEAAEPKQVPETELRGPGPVSSAPPFLDGFGRPGNGPGQFNRPEGLCLDASDRIYVADSCNHRIEVFSSDGRFLRAYGKAGKGPGQFSYPYDIRVDGSGRQYVCEFGNSRIQVFDAHDRLIEIIGGPGALPGQFNNPWSLALDSAGNLYVADSQNHRVQKLVHSPESTVHSPGSTVHSPGSTVHRPESTVHSPG